VHGSIFEFVRKGRAFDAGIFLTITAGWINVEFRHLRGTSYGVTNGGPLVIPGLYDGAEKTFYLRSIKDFDRCWELRRCCRYRRGRASGIDTTTFPGDTLTVPVNAGIASILARYPRELAYGAFRARNVCGFIESGDEHGPVFDSNRPSHFE